MPKCRCVIGNGLFNLPERRTVSYLIGMDEAGYGPPLGPLVVAGSVWEIDDQHACDPVDVDLYQLLRHCVCRRPSRASQAPPRRLPIADSKATL